MTGTHKYLVAIVLGLAVTGASPALAHEAYAPDGGSHVWDNPPSHDHFSVNDSACDGHSAYGHWNNGNNRLDNNSGCGTTVKTYGLNVSSVQACTNIPLASDPCSNWA